MEALESVLLLQLSGLNFADLALLALTFFADKTSMSIPSGWMLILLTGLIKSIS